MHERTEKPTVNRALEEKRRADIGGNPTDIVGDRKVRNLIIVFAS